MKKTIPFRSFQILLLQPRLEDFYATDCRTQPLGLAYLAGSLKKRFPGIDVSIFDCLAGGRKRTIPWPQEFQYLKPYYGHADKGPFALFHPYYRFGKTDEEIREHLRSRRPDLIGISCLFTPYYRESLKLARLCREMLPGVPIVMGGSHASLHPLSLLFPPPPFGHDENLCDFVIRGEGDESICELVEFLSGSGKQKDVSNIVTRETSSASTAPSGRQPPPALPPPEPFPGGGAPLAEKSGPVRPSSLPPLKPPDRKSLPMPEFPGLAQADYTYNGTPMSFLLTSRGCPMKCAFCTVHSVFGEQYEKRSPDAVLDEIRLRFDQGIRHFDIEDDNFTFNRGHCLEILSGIIGLGLPITLSAMNGLHYLSLDEEILSAMKRAGFDTLNLSLVSMNGELTRALSRPTHPDIFRKVLELAGKLDLKAIAYIILGLPGQDCQDMWESLMFLAGARCLIGPSPYYHIPGSPLDLQPGMPGLLIPASKGKDPFFSARLTAMDMETPLLSRDDIYTCFRMARVLNDCKNGIDRGLSPDDPFFLRAREVFSTAQWFAASDTARHPLPFSEKIRSLLKKAPVKICGYASSGQMVIET